MDISKQFRLMHKNFCNSFIWLFIFSCSACGYKYVEGFSNSRCRHTGISLKCPYIPRQIPEEVTHVYLQNIKRPSIWNGTFAGKNWNHVIFLQFRTFPQSTHGIYGYNMDTIEPYGMEGLDSLDQLEIIVPMFTGLDYGSFAGLGKLRILNFTGCESLELSTIIKAVNGSDTLPNLEVFSITYISTRAGIEPGKDFFEAFKTKPLKLIDVHEIDINNIHLRYCKPILDTLQYLNFSGSHIGHFNPQGMDKMPLMKNPKLLDVSHATFPKDLFSYLKYLRILINLSFMLSFENFPLISNIETLDLTGINNKPLITNNLTLHFIDTKYGHSNWTTKNIIARNNFLRHIDLTIICKSSTIEMIDLSSSNIEFLRPTVCTCCFNLKEINLSDNKLFKMAQNNYSIFEQLPVHLPALQVVNLSANQLNDIPKEMFTSTLLLQVIDLSNNYLQQIKFNLSNSENLTLLNLQYNRISILDAESINNLESYSASYVKRKNLSGILDLKHNPLSCATCETLPSVTWLANTKLVYRSENELSCRNSDGKKVPLDAEAIKSVQALCHKIIRIRLVTILTPSITAFLIVSAILVRVSWKRYAYKRNMKRKVQRIYENTDIKEYLLFISYCDDDYKNMLENILTPLKCLLEQQTGVERDLICFAEKDFIRGHSIFKQSDEYLSKSEVTFIILSHNYTSNPESRTIFEHIFSLNMPMVIFKLDNITETEVRTHLTINLGRNTCFSLEEDLDKQRKMWNKLWTSFLEKIP